VEIPEAVKEIQTLPVIHDTVVDVKDMKTAVKESMNL
jgi:hypothetical protein